jgi:hypothetical protein
MCKLWTKKKDFSDKKKYFSDKKTTFSDKKDLWTKKQTFSDKRQKNFTQKKFPSKIKISEY